MTGYLDSDQENTSTSDLCDARRSPRHPADLHGKCFAYILKTPDGRDAPIVLARILNISEGGIGLHLGERFEAGTVVTLALRIGPVKHHVQASIVHVVEQQNGTWVMGLAFSEPIGDAILKPFLS